MTTDPNSTDLADRADWDAGWRPPRDSSITEEDFVRAAKVLLPAELVQEIEHFTPWWDEETPGGFSPPFTDGVVLTLVGADFLAWRRSHRQLFPVYDGDGEATFAALEQAWSLLDVDAARSVEIDLTDPSVHGGIPGIVVTSLGASGGIPDQTFRAVSAILEPVGFTLLDPEAVVDRINQGTYETPIYYLWVR